MPQTLGANLEREIREQPDVWERVAASDAAERLAAALDDEVLLVGSGSSLFAGELGALALRRRRVRAHALAATEARLDHRAYENAVVVAVSQSGRSADLLDALDILRPRRLIALTNTIDSPLAARAHLTIDVGAGPEIAVPATKSVTSTAAILLRAASVIGDEHDRTAAALRRTAGIARAWFDTPSYAETVAAAHEISGRRNVVVLGSDYGLPIAREAALKLKEAGYLHAEGFAAGEFRHGSIAMVDTDFSMIGFVDEDAFPVVARPMREAASSGALRYLIGEPPIDGIPRLGPTLETAYNTLGWLLVAQTLALHIGRARGVDGDLPRTLTKSLG